MRTGERNLAVLAERSLDTHGDYESLFFEGKWHSSGELFDRARRLAAGFGELGIEPGDRVVVMMSNCPEVTVTYNALWRAGAVVTPAIFLLPPDELRHVLADSGARAIVTTPEFLLTIRLAADGLDDLEWIVCLGGQDEDQGDLTRFEHLEQAEPGTLAPRDDTDLAALMYTGGTTGRAKGVMLSHRNLWSCARSAHEASTVAGLNRVLMPLPLAHAFGLIVTVVGMHADEPGQAVLMRWFDVDGFLQLAQDHRVHRFTVVPSMLQMLLAADLDAYDLSDLRAVSIGAAPLAPELITEFEQRVPTARVLEGYGCTESGGVISTNTLEERRVGSVGKPIPGYEVRLEAGPEDAEGYGEICVRAEGVMRGYWNAPEATADALRDGWFHTGDVGRFDDDGFLFIGDRKKDLIIRGGFNVFPRDVEDAMVGHPAVAMCGVVGRPDPKYGEEVVAFVTVHPGEETTADELVAWAKDRLGGYKYPREVHIVDDFPLTPVGKTDRKTLRARIG